MKHIRLILAIALALTIPTLLAPPAHAAGEVAPYMQGGVLYDSCDWHPFSYSLSLPPGYSDSWDMDFSLVGPDGNEIDTAYGYDGSTSAVDFFICESPNLVGTYWISGQGSACNPDYDCVAITATPTPVSFRLPRTRTSLTASTLNPSKGDVVRFVIKTRDERPNGYFAAAYADVALQVRRPDGSWRIVGSMEMTDSQGRVVVKARYTGGRKKVRAVTYRDDDYTGSKSITLTVR